MDINDLSCPPSLVGRDVLGDFKCVLFGGQFKRVITYIWEHFIKQKRYQHFYTNATRGASQNGICGKSKQLPLSIMALLNACLFTFMEIL